MSVSDFDTFLSGLSSLGVGSATGESGVAEALISQALDVARALERLDDVTAETLAALIKEHPRWVPFLASCVGLV